MANPINLTSLSQRESIVDALYRAVVGLDSKDSALFKSAWAKENPCFEGVRVMEGMASINMGLFEPLSKMEVHHTISNVRVDIKDGKDTAYMTAYGLNQHHRLGEGMDPAKKGLLGGVTYFIDLVKDSDDGLWKMKKWAMTLNWCDGDLSVVSPEA